MRTAWASSLRRLGASLLAVMLCAVLVQPVQAITSSSYFTSAVPVTEKTAYIGVLVVVMEPCTGLYGADNPVNKVDPSGHDYGDFSINLGSIYSLLLNTMLAQYNSATPDVMSGRTTNPWKLNWEYVKDTPADSAMFTTLDGDQFPAPKGTDFNAVYKAGQATTFRYDYYGIKAAVGHFGKFDYQRNMGHGELIGYRNYYYYAYVHASNYAVGVFMNGVGWGLDDTISWATDFAHKNSNNPGDLAEQKKWWTSGWNAAKAGTPNGQSSTH